MKPLNHKELSQSKRKFTIAFSINLFIIGIGMFFTFFIAKKGMEVLTEKQTSYNHIFQKQAAITFEIDHITKMLYQLKNKNRTLSEHRQFQGIINELRSTLEENMEKDGKLSKEFELYGEMLSQIKAIQNTIDIYEEQSEEYEYNKELLERCRKKYREDKLKMKEEE
ncbi:type VI secretion system TssO [Aureivirga marina]|uniref:type VI secretion system TssO n=1 Tax=Aureivirga marina TaxID=1182451 RepID=UPI0018C9C258|nr:type VI secretion system TssO [Aureivirga marina]